MHLPLFWRQKSGGKNRRPAKNFDLRSEQGK
jgi:hypothetical protein